MKGVGRGWAENSPQVNQSPGRAGSSCMFKGLKEGVNVTGTQTMRWGAWFILRLET